jgi:ribosomal protein L13
MRTRLPLQRNWYVVDGTNQTVGRMCSKIAAVLRGKNKAYYTPHVDCGDFVIVTNCEKVKFTGNKMDEKCMTLLAVIQVAVRKKAKTFQSAGLK